MLVDGCLRRLGVTALSLIVLTHLHADHVDGLAGVLRGRSADAVVVPTFEEPASGRSSVRAAAQAAGVPVVPAGPGWTYERGSVRLRAIGPVQPLLGTRSDPNNNSLVLFAELGGVTALLTGDAETPEQQDLVRDVGAGLRVDVLKVAHHGSSYQDSELLDAARPRVALVSVGKDNPYGHPSLGVLNRLAGHGARVLRTDLDGDLAVVVTGSGLGVVTTRAAARDPTGQRSAGARTALVGGWAT
jgi:competence protein ComEC